jgi:hypothetical protein
MKKFTLNFLHKLAEQRNGKCLSTEYSNCKTPIKWKCNLDGCEWNATTDNVKCGSWCPKCAKVNLSENHKIYTISDMHKIAEKRDGMCLSKEYKNSNSKIQFQCNKDKTKWFSTPKNICKGTWCPTCAHDKRKYTLGEIQKTAKEKGGECLSKNYINNKNIMKWQCNKDNNIWFACLRSIVNNKTWCPECSSFKTEKLCRKYLEKETGCKFPKTRPICLRKLELDGYCKELNLAFEYNGIQHYKLYDYINSKILNPKHLNTPID